MLGVRCCEFIITAIYSYSKFKGGARVVKETTDHSFWAAYG